MRKAADTRSVALIPFMPQRDRLVLERHGITDLIQLAQLKELPPKGSRHPFQAADGKEQLVEELNAEWLLGAKLALHVRRALAAA